MRIGEKNRLKFTDAIENAAKCVETCIIFTKSQGNFLGANLLIPEQQYDIIAISNKIDNYNINFPDVKCEKSVLN